MTRAHPKDRYVVAWLLVIGLAIYVAPHAMSHVKSSPCFDGFRAATPNSVWHRG